MLPNEPHGFAVDLKAGVVHKRYASHATGMRRTTARGVENMLAVPQLCEDCFPQPKPVRSSTRFSPKSVKVVEPKAEMEVEPVPSAKELYEANLAAEEAEPADGED